MGRQEESVPFFNYTENSLSVSADKIKEDKTR